MHFTFETYRLIQCKRPLLTELEYNYRWSGSISPKISSENQRIEELACRTDDNCNTAIIKFKKPLTFNESAVLHIKTSNDDAKGDALSSGRRVLLSYWLGEIRCERSLCLFKTSLSFPKKHLYTSLITLYLIYSAYICELSTVRAIYQQNKHCFDWTLFGSVFNV